MTAMNLPLPDAPGAEGADLLTGRLFTHRLEHVREHLGAAGVEKVLRALSDDDRAALRSLDREGWYPFALFLRLDRTIAGVLAPGDPAVFESLGRDAARRRTVWLGANAPLVSVHAFLARMAEEHRTFHSFGSASYVRLRFNEGEIAFSGYPSELDPIYCASARGYLLGAIEVLTGLPGTVVEERCQTRGDGECAFRLRWPGREAQAPGARRTTE